MFDNLPPLNYPAIVVAAIASIAIMAIWYGLLFGKKWMALQGITEQPPKNKMIKSYVIATVASLVMSYVLANALAFAAYYLDISGLPSGLMSGFFNWLGFIAPVTLGPVLWQGKSWKIWLIDAGYYLVALLAMGTILAMWPVAK